MCSPAVVVVVVATVVVATVVVVTVVVVTVVDVEIGVVVVGTPTPAVVFVASDPEFCVAVIIPEPPALVLPVFAVVLLPEHAVAIVHVPIAIAIGIVVAGGVARLMKVVTVIVADLTGGKELFSGFQGLIVVNKAFQAVLVLVERVEGIQSPEPVISLQVAGHVFVREGVIKLIVGDDPVVILVSKCEEFISEFIDLFTVPVVIVVFGLVVDGFGVVVGVVEVVGVVVVDVGVVVVIVSTVSKVEFVAISIRRIVSAIFIQSQIDLLGGVDLDSS